MTVVLRASTQRLPWGLRISKSGRCLVIYFLCSNSVFQFLALPRSYLFARPICFRPYTRAANEATAATQTHPLYIPGALGTRKIRCLQSPFWHPCLPGPPTLFGKDILVLHVCVGPVGFSRRRLQTTSDDPSTVLHPVWHERPTSIRTS